MRIKHIEKQLLFPKDQVWFRNCHASTFIKIGQKNFLVAFFAGESEGTPDMAIWLSRCINGEWQCPVRCKYIYGLPHWNPVLHRDGGKILLYYKVGPSVPRWYTMVSESFDNGVTWSESRELIPEDHTPRLSSRNKLLVASNGDWLGPCSVERETTWDSYIDISHDRGATWEIHPIPIDHILPAADGKTVWSGLAQGALWENELTKVLRWDGIIQPTLWESQPGRIHGLMRSTRGEIYRSDSGDYGRTWCKAYPTGIPNNNSGIDICKLDNGVLVLVYNPVSGNWGDRTPLSISLSEDNGKTFSQPVHLETQAGEYSYPAVIADGRGFHLTYTDNRKGMVYSYVEVDFEEGRE